MSPSPDPEGWIEKYGDALYRHALAILGQEAEAEDCVQETFSAALEGLSGFSGRSTEKTWLFGILKHKIVDRIREESRFRLVETSGEEEPFDAFLANGKWVRPPSDWGDPEKSLENLQFWAVFEECLKGLSPGVSKVFVLKALEDRSMEDICVELGISPVNGGVRMYRARLALRKCLERRWFEKDS